MKDTLIRVLRLTTAALLTHAAVAGSAAAQQAMTVSGHVTSRGAGIAGAHVRVTELRIDRVTDAEGRYSFVISGSSVRGQSVKITASMDDRRARYAPKSISVVLSGGTITQDFELQPMGDVAIASQPNEPIPGAAGVPGVTNAPDTLELSELAGAISLPAALAGRVPGLDVMTSTVLGGSTQLRYRGTRSLLGTSQPLFVVDGLPMDNTTFTSSAQRSGLGGFDYGSPLQDIDPANVETIRFVSGAEAVARFGGRAANGVFLITTRTGAGSASFAISASQQLTSESIGELPEFQNLYGQGLNGKFQFFNGRGGGVNDNVDQSWGPALNGSPVAQASYTDAGRADVRLFSPQPDNVSAFFRSGRTLDSRFGVQGGSELASYRIFGSARDTRGLTFSNSLTQRQLGVALTLRPVSRFTLAASTTIAETKNQNATGTGYDAGNPYSQFTRLGRQVNLDSLRAHVRDASGNQISWNYAGQNNPFFAALVNSNHSLRDHAFGALTATYALSPALMLTARGGADYFRDGRLFSIGSGWMGGYPFVTGQGDFSRGGSQGDEVTVKQNNVAVRLDDSRTLKNGVRWVIGGGVDMQSSSDRTRTAGVDSAANVPSAGAPSGSSIPAAVVWTADARTTGVFGETSLQFADAGFVRAALRNEWSSVVSGQNATTLYPAISASYDLRHAFAGLRDTKALSSATVRGSLSRTGGNLTSYALQTLYNGRAVTGGISPTTSAVTVGSDIAPEITNTAEVGTDLSFANRRVGLGLTLYDARTTGVILPVDNATHTAVRARNAGEVTNAGVEAYGSLRAGDSNRGFGFELSGNVARNSNQVDKLYDTVSAVALGPTIFGASIEARTGEPLGVITGRPYLRDASGALLLSNGLPVPDLTGATRRLGTTQPKWILGLRSALRYRWFSLEATADAHVGGQIFSATKLWGDFAGNLAETSFRPDSGLLIEGVDAVTKRPNTQHVSTQDYYHALGAIQEPWIYSASYMKLRDLRFSLQLPTIGWHLPFESASISLVARNLRTWSTSRDFDPEVVLSPYGVGGMELGQYPATKSVGLQLSLTP